MDKRKNIGVVVALLVGGLVVLASMYLFIGPLLVSDSSRSTCTQTKTPHTAVIRDGKIYPNNIQAKMCDTLTVINNDAVTRLMAFGKHEKHSRYDGISEKRLSPGQSLTVSLGQTGAYLVHDHYDEYVSATFTVSE